MVLNNARLGKRISEGFSIMKGSIKQSIKDAHKPWVSLCVPHGVENVLYYSLEAPLCKKSYRFRGTRRGRSYWQGIVWQLL